MPNKIYKNSKCLRDAFSCGCKSFLTRNRTPRPGYSEDNFPHAESFRTGNLPYRYYDDNPIRDHCKSSIVLCNH